MVLLVLYVIQVIFSFWALSTAWRFDFDLTLGTAIVFGLVSLAPICFIPALFILVIEWSNWKSKKAKIVKPRRIVFKKF